MNTHAPLTEEVRRCAKPATVCEHRDRQLRLAIDKLREWAAECMECDGTRLSTMLGRVIECPDCMDIHLAIDECTAER